MDNNDLRDFEQFMQRRDEAAHAYVCGDATPLGRIVARVGDATFYPPDGRERWLGLLGRVSASHRVYARADGRSSVQLTCD